MDFILSSLRKLFFMLDQIVYGLIDDVYGLLMQITRTTLFDQEIIHQFAERIYAFIGIFMLFKITISLITYVLNPDDFSDKEKGFSSIIKRIILSLVMVVLVPYIFSEAYDLQSIILEENTIMNVVFGSPSAEELQIENSEQYSNSSYTEAAGQKIQFTILYAFAQPNYEEFFGDNTYDLSDCQSTYVTDENGNYKFRMTPTFEKKASKESSFIYALNESCWGTYNPESDTYTSTGENGYLYSAFKNAGSEDAYQNYAQGVAQQSFSLFFRREVITAADEESGRYLVNYKAGISTAVGVGVLYLFLMFCIDIALRSIKLGFLQMIAPVPIISYCDPKSSKDGMFSKWVKMCTNTYLELFIRLFALYFGIYVISLIGTFKDVVTGEPVTSWIVNIFMIIGVLMFVKKLPEILKDVFGFKGDMKFNLNPLKKIEDEALGGKMISSAGKKAIGIAGGTAAGTLAATGGFLTGQGFRLGAIGKGISGGFKGDKFGKNFASSYGAAREKNRQLKQMEADGVSRGDVFKAKAYNAFHGQTKAEKMKGITEGLKTIQDDYKSYTNTVAGIDAIAKEMDQRKKAAEAAGNYDEMKKWSDAFDLRVKDIAKAGGKVAESLSGDIKFGVGADGKTKIDYGSMSVNYSANANASLQNISTHMEGLAKELNAAGKDIAGYENISTDVKNDIKKVRNTALGSQQSVETNAEYRKIQAVDNYANNGNKK